MGHRWYPGAPQPLLAPAADDDLGAGEDHGAGGGGLLADSAVAADLHGETGGGRLLNDLAHGESEERGNLEALGFDHRYGFGLLLGGGGRWGGRGRR